MVISDVHVNARNEVLKSEALAIWLYITMRLVLYMHNLLYSLSTTKISIVNSSHIQNCTLHFTL